MLVCFMVFAYVLMIGVYSWKLVVVGIFIGDEDDHEAKACKTLTKDMFSFFAKKLLLQLFKLFKYVQSGATIKLWGEIKTPKFCFPCNEWIFKSFNDITAQLLKVWIWV